MTGRSRFIMLAACALQVLVVAGSIAWVAITGSGETAPAQARADAAPAEAPGAQPPEETRYDGLTQYGY
jgi:hypothetical protein